MTRRSQAYKAMPDVPCPTCGHLLPKLSRYPMPEDLQLPWGRLQYPERRLMAACIIDHRQQPYREWRPMYMAERGNMKYRTVCNALRRLVPCGWLQRVSRGVYRITPYAVESLEWTHRPRWTITKITDCAQVPGTEDTQK